MYKIIQTSIVAIISQLFANFKYFLQFGQYRIKTALNGNIIYVSSRKKSTAKNGGLAKATPHKACAEDALTDFS